MWTWMVKSPFSSNVHGLIAIEAAFIAPPCPSLPIHAACITYIPTSIKCVIHARRLGVLNRSIWAL